MTTALARPTPFSAADRCDRCGAQAFVRAVLPSGDLMFCAHHGRVYGDALEQVALAVEDGTAALTSR
jgi:hypothetical protein